MTITVFLLDDHEMVRRGLRDILATEDDIDVIGEAGTVDEGARGIVGMRPDVALVDIVLPDGNGVKVCEALRTYAPDVRTLVLTSFSDDDTLFAAIDAGAAGVVLKRLGGDELIDSVRCVHEGTSVIDPRLTDRMFNRLRARREFRRGALGRAQRPRASTARAGRRGPDQPPDRCSSLPVGENGEELCERDAAEAQDANSDRSGRLRHPARRSSPNRDDNAAKRLSEPASGRQSAKNACQLARACGCVPRPVWLAGQSASGWSSGLCSSSAP